MNVRFGEFRLDSDTRQLFRVDEEVHLSPKAFELLGRLLEARPKALSKHDLSERLWPATFVSAANLSVLIAEIRRAIGDDPRKSQFVRTVQRFGYAFCGSAVDVRGSGDVAGPAVPGGNPSYWLISGTRRIALAGGENIVGRDPQVTAWLDVPGISRRHARIVITNENMTIEDLGSKNGTYVRGERVASPTRVLDGDEVRLGTVCVTFRAWSTAGSTESQPPIAARPPSS